MAAKYAASAKVGEYGTLTPGTPPRATGDGMKRTCGPPIPASYRLTKLESKCLDAIQVLLRERQGALMKHLLSQLKRKDKL